MSPVATDSGETFRAAAGRGRPLGTGRPVGAQPPQSPPRSQVRASPQGVSTAGRERELETPRSLAGLAAIYSRRLRSGGASGGTVPSVALDGSTRLRNAGKWRPPRAGPGRAGLRGSGRPLSPPRERWLRPHRLGFRNKLQTSICSAQGRAGRLGPYTIVTTP